MKNDYGYIRITCVTPQLKLGDVKKNADEIIKASKKASDGGCDIVLFPELALTGYTCADLFQQSILYKTASSELSRIAEETSRIDSLIVFGMPVQESGRMYNCAAVLFKGRIIGIVPKTYIPNYNEFYEARWFSSGADSVSDSISLAGKEVPFGCDLLFKTDPNGSCTIGVELCEDMWAPLTPSTKMSLAGADIILNLSASNELAGKADYRRELISKLSGQQLSVYAYCSSGVFESSTDTVYGGHRIIAENGHILSEGSRFSRTENMITADADTDFIIRERINNKTFSDCTSIELVRSPSGRTYRLVDIEEDISAEQWNGLNRNSNLTPENLLRYVDDRPFVPSAEGQREARCEEIFSIQSAGLASRLHHIGFSDVVVGLSGGLDSTLALLVCIEAFRSLDLPFRGIHCITMPGFGTSGRTKNNAGLLCSALGIEIETINIADACRQHFKDIGHDESHRDVTYENTQARERTQILMDKANMLGAIVVGTGDLSEQAMGWSTYNGDHMSMYSVNTGVPKTLVRFLVEYYINNIADEQTAKVLEDINSTPISPELLPPDDEGNISQKTEERIGPYELIDFFLYQVVRCGYSPAKVLFLAESVFRDRKGGKSYSSSEIKKWLILFYRRFFSQQFKRSCVPDGPKAGTIALSPRSDWRMPSDMSVKLWLEELGE